MHLASTARSPVSACPATASNCVKSRRSASVRRCSSVSSGKTYAEADRRKGQTGENLLQLLEGRLMPSPTVWALVPPAPKLVRSFVTTASWSMASGEYPVPYTVRPGDEIQHPDR